MPVPTWDCSELVLLDEPVDVTTVVSEDIWKKFDLDFPQAYSADRYYGTIEDGLIQDSYNGGSSSSVGLGGGGGSSEGRSTTMSSMSYEKSLSTSSKLDAREIRHHDCMWAGLCISKEHNRTHPAKKDLQINSKSKIPAGRSLLINRKHQGQQQQQQQHQQQHHNHQYQYRQQIQTTTTTTTTTIMKNLESDGDSTRPETPQSCESETEEEDSEDEIPRFKHDSISINDKLSEYIGSGVINVPVSEVTGQSVCSRKTLDTSNKKIGGTSTTGIKNQHTNHNNINNMNNVNNNINNNNNNKYVKNDKVNNDKGEDNNNINRTTSNINYSGNTTCTNIVSLGDHCYHLNQTSSCSKKLEHLGVQTPSDSEEEIDVVTFDKPCRPASLPTNPSLADKQHLQKTVTSALKDKSPPRPRGRPPSNAPRKRSAQTEPKPAKRPKHKSSSSYQQKRATVVNNNYNEINDDVNNAINTNNSRLLMNETDYEDGAGAGAVAAEVTRTTSSELKNVERNDRIKNYDNNNRSCGDNAASSRGGGNKSSSMSRSSSDDEPDTEKRSLHNNMERQRRIELRNAFEELRVLVPEVEMKEKAPKVVILRQAAVYCDMLTEIEQNRLATANELRKRQSRLRTKLSQLRRNFRSERRGAEVNAAATSSYSSYSHATVTAGRSNERRSGLQG